MYFFCYIVGANFVCLEIFKINRILIKAFYEELALIKFLIGGLMKITIIEPKAFVKNEWSGGATTQLYIYPKNSELAKRNFKFRISSATFTDTSSTFSDFTEYQRFLLPLKGHIYLSHKQKYETTIQPYEVEYFKGDWSTYSENTLDTVDFNLIVKENIQCNLSVLNVGEVYIPKRAGKLMIFSTSDCTIEAYASEKEEVQLKGWSLLVIDEEEQLFKLTVKKSEKAGEKVIFCEVNE